MSLLLAGLGCGDDVASHHPYADQVVSFTPGDGSGYGQEGFPDNVLGPPNGAGSGQGATDGVLSLGIGGTIVVSLDQAVVDQPGPDLVVFENPFEISGTDDGVWAEFGEVSVSGDGVSWFTFACRAEYDVRATWKGCAGWNPVLPFDPDTVGDRIDPAKTGGDAFDLADLGEDDLPPVRFVRVRDLARSGVGPSAGFDLDAVAGIY
jgi:hypothetical protein